jgi:hypothetical protein
MIAPIRLLLALAGMLALAAAGATAGPLRSIADCEAVQEADAYNRCLASFGPAASGAGRRRGVEPAEQRARAPSHEHGHGSTIERGRGGRLRLVLTPSRGR